MGKGTLTASELESSGEKLDDEAKATSGTSSPSNKAPINTSRRDPSTNVLATTTIVTDDDASGDGIAAIEDHGNSGASSTTGSSSVQAADDAATPRPVLLKQQLVTDYRRNKQKSDTEQLPAEEEKSVGDKISGVTDWITLASGAVVDSESIASDWKDWQNDKIDDTTAKDFAIASFADSGATTLNSLYKTHGKYKKLGKSYKKQKNDQAKDAFWGGVGFSAAGILGSTAKGIKAFTDKDNETAKDWAKYLGLTGSIADVAGSFMAMKAGRSENKEHNRIVEASSAWNDEIRTQGPQKEIDVERSAKDPNLSPAEHAEAVRQRNAYKAKKYSMSMAQDFNNIKGGQIEKGGFGFARSLFSLGQSALKAFGTDKFLKSSEGMGLKLLLNFTGAALKYGGKLAEFVSDKNAAKDIQGKKDQYLDEYISKKSEDLNGIYAGAALTPKEKARVVVGRLGLDVEITDTALSPADRSNAFKLLALKRANNILNSPDATKHQMLEALGLEDDATAEQIAAVMTGE